MSGPAEAASRSRNSESRTRSSISTSRAVVTRSSIAISDCPSSATCSTAIVISRWSKASAQTSNCSARRRSWKVPRIVISDSSARVDREPSAFLLRLRTHMRTNLLAPLVALGLAAATSCSTEQRAGAVQSAADVELIRELEAKSWVAWKAQDAAFFERFLSEDHVEVHGYGITGRTAVVGGIRSGICVVQSYSLGTMSTAVVAPDAVLVTYRA